MQAGAERIGLQGAAAGETQVGGNRTGAGDQRPGAQCQVARRAVDDNGAGRYARIGGRTARENILDAAAGYRGTDRRTTRVDLLRAAAHQGVDRRPTECHFLRRAAVDGGAVGIAFGGAIDILQAGAVHRGVVGRAARQNILGAAAIDRGIAGHAAGNNGLRTTIERLTSCALTFKSVGPRSMVEF